MAQKVSSEYLQNLVDEGHLTEEGMKAILDAQAPPPRAKYYRVKLSPDDLAELQKAHPALVFESLYEARKKK